MTETETTSKDFRERLERKNPTQFHKLTVGRFVASIQASATHYCSPRETLPSATDYGAFEIAIFEGEREDWVNPRDDERFKGKAWASEFESEMVHPVAGWQEVATIEQILADLQEASDAGN